MSVCVTRCQDVSPTCLFQMSGCVTHLVASEVKPLLRGAGVVEEALVVDVDLAQGPLAQPVGLHTSGVKLINGGLR